MDDDKKSQMFPFSHFALYTVLLHLRLKKGGKKMRFAILIFTLLLVFTFSCAPMIVEGRKIDSAKLDQLNVGQTKVAKIEELFGKPDKVDKLPSGDENYIYFYRREIPRWWTVDKIDKQKMEIFIKDGVVQKYRYSIESRDVITREDK